MKIYIITLVIIFVFASMVRYIDEKPIKSSSKVLSRLLIISIFFILSILSGLRYGIGTDFFPYRTMYLNIYKIDILESRDFGYVVLNRLVHLISDNPQWIFIITSLIINGLMIYVIRKESKLFEISIYLYITSYMYFSSFNGIRQWLAASILFFGIKYLFSRNFIKYSIIVVIASTIHQTALIMFIFYFICNCKFKSKKILFLIGIGVAMFIYYMPFVELLMNILEGSKLYNDYNNILGNKGEGINILKFIIALIPVILSYIFYRDINKYNDKNVDILMNFSLVNTLVMLLGIKHWIFARFLMYFEVYNLILYPIIFTRILKKEKILIYYCFIVFYFIFCVLILKSGDSNVIPYKFNLNIW